MLYIYMKPRKTSEVLKYSVNDRLSISEEVDSKCNLTLMERSPQSVNFVLQFMKTVSC